MFLDTVSDIALRAGLYEARTGKPGLAKADAIWFRHIHNAVIFRLGSLQFQLFEMIYLDQEGCGEAYMTFAQEQKARLPQGTPVLNLHIPKGADLSPAAVEQALDQAMEFFPQVFPEHRARAFLYYSWLLYPGLRELLPAGSNILQFAARFRVIGQTQDPAESIRRIYGKRFPRRGIIPKIRSCSVRRWGGFPASGRPAGFWRSPHHGFPRWNSGMNGRQCWRAVKTAPYADLLYFCTALR